MPVLCLFTRDLYTVHDGLTRIADSLMIFPEKPADIEKEFLLRCYKLGYKNASLYQYLPKNGRATW